MSRRMATMVAVLMGMAVLTQPALAQQNWATRVGAAGATPAEIVELTPEYEPAQITPQWGTATQAVMTVRIQDFFPQNNTVTYSTVNTGGIYVFQTSAVQTDWWGSVRVPAGALIERIELQACDTTTTGAIVWGLASMDAPASTGANVTPIGSTGTAATPGCAFFSLNPTTPPLQVDNRNKSYLLFIDWQGDFTSANKVAAVRVFYRLQVSPTPATATFADVPVGHPFHRFVEALVAAGVTGGCGSGLYCPDTPVTRGQMAVFLSVALGLHFPN